MAKTLYLFSYVTSRHRLCNLTFFFFLALTLAACKKDTDDPVPDPVYLIESEIIAELSSDDIRTFLDENVFPSDLAFLVRNDILVYKIVYQTIDTDNMPVLASGALLVPVPDGSTPLPLISFQHGTITSDEDAPSNFRAENYFVAAIYSSAGFIIALPDYLGYGSSSHLPHPYEHGNSLATASRDMLRAVKEFDRENNNFTANDKLFLTGYSEGGYATMALLKLLEQEHRDEFTITATTVGSGAYNKSEFARAILEKDEELTHLNTFLWVLDTYNNIYNINRSAGQIYNAPYSGIIEDDGVFANSQLNPQILLTNEFRNGFLSGTDQEFIDALADNDNYDWKPLTPLQLYHGTEDDFVFYLNSETAYEAMTSKGANHVELITIEGGDHTTSVFDYFTGSFIFFNQF